jgi:thiamine biosynthesis lipoprotein ApbE
MRFSVVVIFLFLIAGLYSYRKATKNESWQVYVSNFENVLGTSFEMKVSAESPEIADQAEEIALAEVDRLSAILSGYDSASEFNHWQKTLGHPVSISKELFDVLTLFDQWQSLTHGGLNASAQAVSLLWKEAGETQQLPATSAIEVVVKQVQQKHWILDQANQTATHVSIVPLMTNTFVKSYIINAAARKVRDIPGIKSVMINIGGDIVALGDVKEEVHISNPLANAENDLPLTIIKVDNKAVATSGNYRRGFMINGIWYSHIIDPRTGMPVEKVISATVVADNATDAGALATAFNVLGPQEGIQLANNIPGIEYLVVTKNGEHFESKGWHALEQENTKSAELNTAQNRDNEQLANSFPQAGPELTINLELSKFEGRFRRPFVAIWIENSNKETVRNLALWFNKPKWLPDLKMWYNKNYASYNTSQTDLSTISSATRPPGEYALKWDMKDDKGNAVPPGKYTVFIEAAREHGTYQLIKQEIDCRNKSLSIQITGNVEIAAASLEYKKNK